MKNKKLKGKGFNATARKGHNPAKKPTTEQESQNIDMILPGQKGPSGPIPEEVVDQQLVKRNAKKQKRFDQFLQKQLKKDQRSMLFDKISKNSFDSSLLKSSSRLGQVKLTAREKLTRAFLEERAGIESSDKTVNLLVEHTPIGLDVEEEMKSDNEVEHLIGNSSNSKVGIVNRAFGAASIVLDEYELSHTGQTVKMEEPLSNVVTGSALKRSGNSDVKPTITKRQRKSKLSKKKKKSKLSDNDSDSEIDTSKPLWNLNVIAGEEFKAATEKSTESSIPEAKSIPPIKKPTPASLSNPSSKPAFHVKVNRPEAIQLSRMALPVVGEEQVIMEKVMENNVIILCGETGSGKTTQVPQFLYEAGFGDPSHPQFSGMIGITQPRRVAAVSMAKRVSEELNLFNGEVTYQVRYDKAQLGKNTRIKFMTDGILLRELSGAVQSTGSNNTGKPTDLLLSSYSCIIIDEAHERTVGTDILIGWLTRIVKLRNSGKIKGIGPLKLIIMSATLRVEDFTENRVLFPLADGGPPPVVKVDGRQHKVVIHYNKRTPELDFMADVYKKIIKIHTKLPHGGILVFVTGQQEVQILCRKLAQLHSSSDSSLAKINSSQESPDRNMFDVDTDGFEEINGANLDVLDDYDVMEEEDEEEEEQLEYLDGIDEEIADDATKEAVPDKNTKLHILPLYSLLPTKEQLKVFEEPPKGSRLVVIATNVAETSLTIPGIKYVVDCGKVKSRNYDTQTGIQKFQVMWTSSASADQRAGRAGRMGPGHCYRLFSSAVYQNYFEKFSKPEILRTPVEGIVLSMKSMGMNQVVGFPFPTPPNLSHLKDAESQLKVLDAIDDNMKITEVGRLMSQFPVKPRYARMIVAAAQHFPENLHYIIAIVSTLSVGEIFVRDIELTETNSDSDDDAIGSSEREANKRKRGEFFRKLQIFVGTNPSSDLVIFLRAIGAYLVELNRAPSKITEFCTNYFLRPKAMDESVKLMRQLVKLSESTFNVSIDLDKGFAPPNAKQELVLKKIFIHGYLDCVAHLSNKKLYVSSKNDLPVYETTWATENEHFIINSQSQISRVRPAPQWILYDQVQSKQEIMGVTGEVLSLREKPTSVERKWLNGITIIQPEWLIQRGLHMINGKSILEQPEPSYSKKSDSVIGYMSPTFGPKFWNLPMTKCELEFGDAVKYFAKALLEGSLALQKDESYNVFAIIKPFLIAKPNIITKSWAINQSKVNQLLSELTTRKVSSKAQLIEIWKSNSSFILSEYLLWVPTELHSILKSNWPPMKSRNGQIIVDKKFIDSIKQALQLT